MSAEIIDLREARTRRLLHAKQQLGPLDLAFLSCVKLGAEFALATWRLAWASWRRG